jgi:hypothetical protein
MKKLKDLVNEIIPEVDETAETAQHKLNTFLKENHIVLDYEVINNKGVVATNDGFILVASTAPAVKVTAKYE